MLGGAVLTELKDDGGKTLTKIYGTGGTIAEQRYTYPATEQVIWLHQDRITQSFNATTKPGHKFELGDGEFNAEFEPLGAVLPQEDPAFDPDLDPMPNLRRKQGGGNPFEPAVGCIVNGFWDDSCDEGRAHLIARAGWMLGGVFVSFERYVDDTQVSVLCGEEDGPDCVPVGPGPSDPTVSYNVTITPITGVVEASASVGIDGLWEVLKRAYRIYSCDEKLKRVFGDENSYAGGNGLEMRNGNLINRLTASDMENEDVRDDPPASWPHVFGFAMHLSAKSDTMGFGNSTGNIYIPPGFQNDWSEFTNDGAWFYNPTLDLTIHVVHIDAGSIKANLKMGIKNSMGSLYIGAMSEGGGSAGYFHSHIEVHRGRGVPNASRSKFPDDNDRWVQNQILRNKTRLFFPDVFCN